MANALQLIGGSVLKDLESPTKERKVIRIIDIVRKENSMTDKEKLDAIRAEIHRLVDVRGYDREMANDLFTFMDSLPNEPVSDGLEEAAFDYAESCKYDGGEKLLCVEHFKAGAKWGKNQAMAEIQAQSMALAHGCPEEKTSNRL